MLADTGQGESRTDGKPVSRVSATKQKQTNCLRIRFRFASLLRPAAVGLLRLLQQVFFIYVLTLVFFTLPCRAQPQVFKVNQSGRLYMPGCICNLMELSIYHRENVGERAGAQPLSITQTVDL